MGTEGKNVVNASATASGAAFLGVDIPEEAEEMVRSVKEVVNNKCTDGDIYAALIDSNMKPDDAVQILLCQDTFHEVKSKRQKRREMMETLEPRAQGTSGGCCGLRISGEQNLGSLLSQSSSSYNDVGKASYRRGSGSVSPILPSSSDFFIADNKGKNEGTGSTISSTKQSVGSQTERLAGASGCLSMALQMETATSPTAQDANSQDLSPHHLEMPCDSPMEMFNMSSISGIQKFSNQSYVYGNEAKSPKGVQESEEDAASNNNMNIDGVASLSTESAFCTGMCERHEGTERSSHSLAANDPANGKVSAATAKLKQLSLGEKPMVHSSADNRVVFPKYLQALAAECPNLSFGTYRPSDLAAKSSPWASNSLEDNSKPQASGAIYGPSVAFLETRNSGHLIKNFHDEQLGFMPDSHGQTTNIINHQIPIFPKVARGDGYTFPSPLSDSNMKNRWEPSSSWPLLKNPAARNVPPLPWELQASSTPLPVDPLASEPKSIWEPRLAYSSFGAQSVPSRHRGVISAVGGPTISMSEMLNCSSHTLLKSNAPALSGAGLAKGPVLPQRQSVHSCSQHDLSLEELVKLNNSLACTHEQSALQHSHRDCRTLHEGLAGMKGSFPWFRGGVPRSSLPLSDSIPSYGSLGGPNDSHKGFRHNLVSPLTGSTAGYDHTLLSRYKEGKFNTMVQQKNDDSSAWEYGPRLRQMSTVPGNISSPGENQVLSRYQPGQRLSQSLGYTTGYHSQAGTPEKQRRQNPDDFAFSNLQGPSTNQLHRRWPWSS